MKHKDKVIVLTVTSSQSSGFIAPLANRLVDSGFIVYVVTGQRDPDSSSLFSEEVRLVSTPMERQPKPLQDMKSFLKWIVFLKATRPDLIIAATPKASLLSLSAARLLGVRNRIYHQFGLRLEGTTGVRRTILTAMERITASSSTMIIIVSESLKELLTQKGLTAGKPIKVLGNGSSHGVDTKYFEPTQEIMNASLCIREKLQISQDDFVIGYIGRLHADKGVDVLIEAAKKIKLNVVLLLVGGDDGAHLDLDHSATCKIVRVGRKDDVRPYLLSMNVFCLPTLREGFPNVSLEAAAMGIPVITTDATGAIDSIRHGKTGIIVRKSDPDSLSSAIAYYFQNPNIGKLHGNAGREFVLRDFDMDHVISRQIEVVTTLLDDS